MAGTTEQKEQKEQGSMVQQAAATVHQAADSATTTVGQGLESLGETVRRNTPREGMLGAASDAVADTLSGGGRYLAEHSPTDMFNDLTDTMRRNAWTTLLVGFGLGFLAARLMKG